MQKVLLFSLLLVAGLIGSQFLGNAPHAVRSAIALGTMFALSFIMIHVGCEFDIDKSKPRQYAWDYVVAGTAAAFPWVFVALYFVFVMAPREMWSSGDLWREALLEARFASPTSAGVLFAMLAAAGLAATWVFKKARVLAIFDDLDTILLMVPLKIMMVGLKWQLLVVVVFIAILIWLAWRNLNTLNWPVTWPFVMLYAGVITGFAELVYLASKRIDPAVPIHLEVLLPAFVLGCVLKTATGAHHDVHAADNLGDVDTRGERRVSTIVSACFMVLVGLSMPPIRSGAPADAASHPLTVAADPAPIGEDKPALSYPGVEPTVIAQKQAFPGWGMTAVHVLAVTVISNIGKLFPVLCYRREATFRERLALGVGMFPRGEVGAGVLVISLSYGLGGPSLTVAVLSLALNLLMTGLFIVVVKKLIAPVNGGDGTDGGGETPDATDLPAPPVPAATPAR